MNVRVSSLNNIKITPCWKVTTPLPVEDKSKCLLDVIIDCQFCDMHWHLNVHEENYWFSKQAT